MKEVAISLARFILVTLSIALYKVPVISLGCAVADPEWFDGFERTPLSD